MTARGRGLKLALMILSLLFLSQISFAQEKSAFEKSLEQDTSVTSDESTVAINGKHFRKIEFNGGRYYVVFHDNSTELADVYCVPPDGAQKEHLIEQPSEPFRRNAAFVRAFHEACAKMKGNNQRTDLHLTPEMGLDLSQGKGKKVIRKKRPND
jgi:hypothetical protein